MKLSKSEIQDLLRQFFPDLKANELNSFLSISKYQCAENKELILYSGKKDKDLVFLLKGVARAYSINENGEELNDFIRAQGKIIGDSRVFGDEVRILNIEAIGEVHYLKFNINKLEALGFENPELMKFYLSILKEMILTFTYRLNTFITMSPKERYIDLLRWNPILIESSYDKHLASFLGIKPLTIYRIKKKLSNDVFIKN